MIREDELCCLLSSPTLYTRLGGVSTTFFDYRWMFSLGSAFQVVRLEGLEPSCVHYHFNGLGNRVDTTAYIFGLQYGDSGGCFTVNSGVSVMKYTHACAGKYSYSGCGFLFMVR
jgi:hypothetical protein